MKMLLLPLMSGICLLPMNDLFIGADKEIATSVEGSVLKNSKDASVLLFQDRQTAGRLSSVVFKNQDYCRAELEDFEFDAKFSVLSATVYFSGTNFKEVERGYITSNSLKPIKKLMDRCLPGSVVVFDDVKVKGPDNLVRTIPGVSLTLY